MITLLWPKLFEGRISLGDKYADDTNEGGLSYGDGSGYGGGGGNHAVTSRFKRDTIFQNSKRGDGQHRSTSGDGIGHGNLASDDLL